MAWTQSDLDALDRAIADGRGARTIQFDNQSITFNSIPEMLQLRSVMKGEVATAAGTSQRVRYASTSKGV